MNLSARRLGEDELEVRTRFALYRAELGEDEGYITAPGLEETVDFLEYPSHFTREACVLAHIIHLELSIQGNL
jgi:hypothetical protein